MEQDVEQQFQLLNQRVTMLAIFAGQAVALLTAEDQVLAENLDALITELDGKAPSAGAKATMMIIRESADRMLSASRKTFRPEP